MGFFDLFKEPKTYEDWLEKHKEEILSYISRQIKDAKKERKRCYFYTKLVWWYGFCGCAIYILDRKDADILIATNFVSELLTKNDIKHKVQEYTITISDS